MRFTIWLTGAACCLWLSSFSPSSSWAPPSGASSPSGAGSAGFSAAARSPSPERQAALQMEVDPDLLLRVCRWETRGERERGIEDRALGDGGRSVGRCQVQIGTAAWQLGLGASDLTPKVMEAIRRMLHEPHINAFFAARELRWCLDRHEGRRNAIERAVHCYQKGRRARWRGPTRDTKNVLLPYAAAKLRQRA